MKAYLSSPAYNDPQIKGHSTLQDYLKEAGFEVLNPNAISAYLADGKTQKTAKEYSSERLALLDEADILISWIDQLQLPGTKLFLLNGVMEKVQVPLPPEIIELISIGMQAKGIAKVKPKSGIIIPGEDPRGLEVTNVPNCVNVHPQGGIIGTYVAGPLNIPDITVVYEMGYASCRGIPTVALAAAGPAFGIMAAQVDLLVPGFDLLVPALMEVKDALDGLCDLGKVCRGLMETYQAAALAELAKQQKKAEEEKAKLEGKAQIGPTPVIQSPEID